MIQKNVNNRPRQKLNFVSPKKRVLQKNIVILHLLVDSTLLIFIIFLLIIWLSVFFVLFLSSKGFTFCYILFI